MAGVGIAFATAASAQTGSNYVSPRAEGTVGSINQSITSQQQGRAAAQQNQFETNSLRNEIGRNPTPYTPPPVGGVAPPVGRIR